MQKLVSMGNTEKLKNGDRIGNKGTLKKSCDLVGKWDGQKLTEKQCCNEMQLIFDSRSCNEGFARVAVASFMTQLNPTLEEVADVKTAVSEAVTNAIIHGYEGNVEKITIFCRICEQTLEVEVCDSGKGIPDIPLAMEPLYTTKAECDRAGMGFAFMEAFMDTLEVESEVGHGTCVRMKKRIRRETKDDMDRFSEKMSEKLQDKIQDRKEE